MPRDQNSTEKEPANGKNKIAHAFRLSLLHFQTLSLHKPCLIVCKFWVALNDFVNKQKVK